jgi:hypothetical protein
MRWIGGRHAGASNPAELAAQATGTLEGGRAAALLSAVALAFSGYSLWDTSLKSAEVHVFVPPVIQYSSPYQNTNFEVFAIPVTMTNDGARTGTVLAMELAVTDPRTKQTKRFYAADFGRWTMEKTRSGAYEPFAPLSLAGRTSRTEQVLFYPRGEEEKPNELVRELGAYTFDLTLDIAEEGDETSKAKGPDVHVTFDRELKFYDARSFQNGTIPMYAADWRSTTNAGKP